MKDAIKRLLKKYAGNALREEVLSDMLANYEQIAKENKHQDQVIDQAFEEFCNTIGYYSESTEYGAELERLHMEVKFEKSRFENFTKRLQAIVNPPRKFGKAIFEAVNEDDNFPYQMGKESINVLLGCKTKEEFDSAEKMLIAICGYGVDTLLGRAEA